jgi:hypothetical protein
MAERFFSGEFGKVYEREFINHLLGEMNKNNADRVEMSNHFLTGGKTGFDENDVEIIVTLELRRIAEE